MIEHWGEAPDGTTVQRARIERDGLSAHLLTFGATLQELNPPGAGSSVVLGYPDLPPYLTNRHHLGSTVGRYANRIANGRAVLDGREITLDRNFLGKHILHGGTNGSSHRNWAVLSHAENEIVFGDTLPDGHMGFPGRLEISARFTIEDGRTLEFAVEARADAPTFCGFTLHNYFNLDGGADIRDHRLRISADRYVPVDEEGIPTGGTAPVSGTPFDFTRARTLADGDGCVVLDHNFCLGNQGRKPVCAAVLESIRSGRKVGIRTTEPGLQVYTGSGITGDTRHKAFAGVALEPQHWPDAPNNMDFPSPVLLPGETYRHVSRFSFG